MPRLLRLSANVLAAMMLLTSTALARDLCIDDTGNGANPDYVLAKFSLPRPGTCRPFAGFHWPAGGYLESAVTGAACAPSIGTVVNFTMTLGWAPNLAGTHYGQVSYLTMALGFPSLQGRCNVFDWGPSHLASYGVVSAYWCKGIL